MHSSFEKIKGYFRFARGISQLLRVCRPSLHRKRALKRARARVCTSSVKERQKAFCEGIFKRAKHTKRLSIFFYYNFPRLLRSRGGRGGRREVCLTAFPQRFTRRDVAFFLPLWRKNVIYWSRMMVKFGKLCGETRGRVAMQEFCTWVYIVLWTERFGNSIEKFLLGFYTFFKRYQG